jgi:hypothetical protein
MGTKTGIVVGFAAGYVLGARAGRERYHQIVEAYHRFTGNPTVQQVAERSKEIAGDVSRKGLHTVQEGVSKVTTSVRHRLGEEDEGSLPASTGI